VRIPDSNLIDDVTVDDASIAAFVENNEGDIRARYEADFKRLYKKSRRVKLSQIIINPDVESDQGARVTIDSVLAQARSGADFAELARTHSHDLSAANGGDVGVMAEEQLSPSIAAAVFATAVGGITEVVTQNDGLFIAKVEEIIPAETTEFDTVKEEIARTITSEKGVGAISQAYAERVLADWTTNGTPSTEILAEQSVFSMDTPPFPIGAPNFPGLSDSPALIKALNTADGPVVFSTIFPVPGGRIIAELTQLDRPTDADFERDKDSIRRRLEAMARNEWVAAWKNDLVARADVRQHWHP
jgi:hypothetical protein